MYLDPGFGGMLLQVIVAIIAMGGAILFSIRKKIRNLFTKNKNSKTPPIASSKINPSTDDDIIDALEENKK